MIYAEVIIVDFVRGTSRSALCVLAHFALHSSPVALVYYPHFTKEELRLRMF